MPDGRPFKRRRPRKGAFLLPSLFTTLNIAFGYYALYHTFLGSATEPWHYNDAAKAIGFAIIFDGLDGRIARMTNTTSDFGREFDSLADVITFGVAPAVLAWMWGFRLLGPINGTDWYSRIVQVGGIATFAFLVAGASRLARFNIQVNPQPINPGRPGGKYFVGMPIPGGAGMIAAVVHFTGGQPLSDWWMALVWIVFVGLTAFLMVSTWRFYSFKGIDFRSPHSGRLIVIIAVLMVLIWYFSQYVLFFLALAYMFSGVIARLMYSVRRHETPPPPPTPYQEASQLR